MRPHVPTRRIATWLAVIGYSLVASGLPLPMGGMQPTGTAAPAKRLAGKDRTTPFPCMDRPCGCATAEQCFSRCCCNTPSRTLAWAKAHRVDPAVIAALERRVAAAAPADAPCCAARRQADCCSAAAQPDETADAAAAKAGPSCGADAPAAGAAPGGPSPGRTVVLRSMLACGGIVAEWLVAGAALPPPTVEVVRPLDPIDRVAVVDEAASCPRAAPAAPPPRAA